MAPDKAATAPAAAVAPSERPGGQGVGRYVVVGVLALTALGAFAVLRDAHSTGATLSVPAAVALPRPVTARVARRDALAFVPAGASLSVAQAIAAATDTRASGLGARARVAPLGGGGWSVTLTVPVDERGLALSGRIFTGRAQGASDLRTGLLQVTSGQTQYVVRVRPATGDARFAFRLSPSGQTLSATNWNANTVLSQTAVGDDLVP